MKDFYLLINGERVAGSEHFDVMNPADESLAGRAPNATDADLERAIGAAERAFESWRHTTAGERRKVLLGIVAAIRDNSDELIDLLITEQGKSRTQAEREVLQQGAAGLEQRAQLELEPEVIQDVQKSRVELHYRPLGVAAAIVPWNFPFGIAIGKLATALMAGCTLILKPSPFTPLTTLRLGELIRDIVPAGVLNILSGDDSLGPRLTAHPAIKKISFTGSIATGKKVMQSAAGDLKRVTLELGGNDAAIVLDDVDVDKVALPLFMGAFVNSGQTCVAIKRVYVHETVYEELVEALGRIAQETKVGPGHDPESVLGPIQNRLQYQRVLAVLDSVKSGGGRIVAGGETVGANGFFLQPTIVADVAEGCPLVDEETFGPILPVIRYSDIDDAVRRANATEYGLGGSVWSSNPERAADIARRLDAGTAWVNQHPALSPLVPFAGAKQSGLGVESGKAGLKEFCQVHVVNIRK
ncbi:aldehyde dehydrogenase family protein [Gilvimarinus sp. F26214L]|uniref:aldehyde dehydrogenase family protein n=1 Tax=Gilvimarinus sp. DZF01 TaxID=3461371 RepID=UPI004045CC0F